MSLTWTVDRIEINDGDPDRLTALRLRSTLPLRGQMRQQFAAMLPALQHGLQRQRNMPMRRYLFLQMADIPRPEGAAALSRHASQWMPGLALGVWPDREPPRSMRKDDFTHRLPGTPFGVPRGEGRQILATDEIDLASVEADFAGSGALVEIFAPDGWLTMDGLAVSQSLLRRVEDESYRSLPFYFPLLDARALESLPAATRDQCLTGVDLYVREDKADHCIVLVTRRSFDDTMLLLQQASS